MFDWMQFRCNDPVAKLLVKHGHAVVDNWKDALVDTFKKEFPNEFKEVEHQIPECDIEPIYKLMKYLVEKREVNDVLTVNSLVEMSEGGEDAIN